MRPPMKLRRKSHIYGQLLCQTTFDQPGKAFPVIVTFRRGYSTGPYSHGPGELGSVPTFMVGRPKRTRPVQRASTDAPARSIRALPRLVRLARRSPSTASLDHRPSTHDQVATSTATIRVPVDHPTIANVSGTAREKSRPTLFRFCTKKITRFVATALIWNLT